MGRSRLLLGPVLHLDQKQLIPAIGCCREFKVEPTIFARPRQAGVETKTLKDFSKNAFKIAPLYYFEVFGRGSHPQRQIVHGSPDTRGGS